MRDYILFADKPQKGVFAGLAEVMESDTGQVAKDHDMPVLELQVEYAMGLARMTADELEKVCRNMKAAYDTLKDRG